jgi:sigma-B regulation protein RsbU (phosphoserine phosphatase)
MMFVTVFLAILNIRTGELRYSNGGHNPPYVKRTDGRVERLDQKHGPVLGPLGGIAYKEDCVTLSAGESLVIYSDGVTEAMNPSRALYGDERLAEFLQDEEFIDPKDLITRVVQSVGDFAEGAEQSDDITLLAVSASALQDSNAVESFTKCIVNQLEEVGTVMSAFLEFAKRSGIEKEVSQKINVAYGFPDGGKHEIEVKAEMDAGRLKITIVDDGVPFNPFQREMPNLDGTLSDRQIGGLGIHIVRQLMDEVFYKRGVDRNTVTLIKHL